MIVPANYAKEMVGNLSKDLAFDVKDVEPRTYQTRRWP